MRIWHKTGLLLVAALLLVKSATSQAGSPGTRSHTTPKQSWSVHANPSRLVNGAPVLFEVTAPTSVTSLTGLWQGHSIVFDPSTDKSWFAIAGVSLEAK